MEDIKEKIRLLAAQYNNNEYFINDPIIFPKHFTNLYLSSNKADSALSIQNSIFPSPINYKVELQDIEIAAVFAAHLAWGRRDMIVRDTKRALDQMNWKPYQYIKNGIYKNDNTSLHRTIKWSEFAMICSNLKNYYQNNNSLEALSPDEFRVKIYGQKSDPKMANKKIHMLRRWMVRNDGIVDLGLWKNISPSELIIPLDVHVHRCALELGITKRKGADAATAQEINNFLKQIFPNDPCLGDFALFAYSVSLRDNLQKSNKVDNI